jgi:copper transport protein
VWWTAAAIALAGPPLAVAAQLAALDRGAADAGTLLTATRWGIALVVQWAAVGVAAAIAAALARSAGSAAPDAPTGAGTAIAAPLVVAVAAVAAASHASSGTDAALGMGIDGAHLAATGVWLGGLAALLALVPRARRLVTDEAGIRLAAAVVVRFSAVAIVCVGVLLVTGVYRALGELAAPSDLVDTGYGQALLVKLAVFLLLLCGGAYNRLVLHPRLERAALGLRPSDAGAADRLAVSVRAELAVAAALMVSVAFLVNLPPP